MTAPGRADLVRLIRAELSDCQSGEAYEDSRAADVVAAHGPGHPFYPLTLVREQFYRSRAASWRRFAHGLRDLLAEMGEQP